MNGFLPLQQTSDVLLLMVGSWLQFTRFLKGGISVNSGHLEGLPGI